LTDTYGAIFIVWLIDVKNVEIKIKNVKKRKKRDKNKKRL